MASLGSDSAVDVHHHWLPLEIIDHLDRYLPDGYSSKTGRADGVGIFDAAGIEQMTIHVDDYVDVERRLQYMDEAGIDIALLSASCYPQWITMKAARVINDAAADLVRTHGKRLRPMVHVPPFGEPGILEEMERGAKLGLTGVCIATNFGGKYPDEDAYLPFLRKAADLDLPVFVHAAGSPAHIGPMDKYELSRTLGRSFEHALVPIRLIFSGVLESIPSLKMVMPHLGGCFFINVKRFFGGPTQANNPFSLERARQVMADHLLFDTAPAFWYGPTEIQCAIANLGVHQFALGSDYPVAGKSTLLNATAHLRELAVPEEDKRQIAEVNVRRLYGRLRP